VDTIPAPLLDRTEIVQLDGCTVQEKLAIAREQLAARQIARNGLDPAEVQVTDDTFLAMIEGYTREAGVRGLEHQIGKLLRKVATRVDSGQLAAPTTIGAGDVKQYLGRSRFTSEVAERTDTPGIATGLAVTGIGGDVLFIEAAHMDGDEGLTLTGQLGDVMKESVRIASSYVRSHAAELSIDPAAFKNQHFHVHVLAGAVPKHGPSAGVTMVTALASLLTGRPVRGGLGMTGEVTLQGKVLPAEASSRSCLQPTVLVSQTSSCPVGTSQIWTTYRSPSALRSTSIRSAQLPKCCRWRYRWMWRRVRDCSKQPEI
jgi:ATP-dependent Lon protease